MSKIMIEAEIDLDDVPVSKMLDCLKYRLITEKDTETLISLVRESYDKINDRHKFNLLMSNIDKYSLEELEKRLK